MIGAVINEKDGEHVGLFDSAIEVDIYSRTSLDTCELLLRIASLSDEQIIDIAKDCVTDSTSPTLSPDP